MAAQHCLVRCRSAVRRVHHRPTLRKEPCSTTARGVSSWYDSLPVGVSCLKRETNWCVPGLWRLLRSAKTTLCSRCVIVWHMSSRRRRSVLRVSVSAHDRVCIRRRIARQLRSGRVSILREPGSGGTARRDESENRRHPFAASARTVARAHRRFTFRRRERLHENVGSVLISLSLRVDIFVVSRKNTCYIARIYSCCLRSLPCMEERQGKCLKKTQRAELNTPGKVVTRCPECQTIFLHLWKHMSRTCRHTPASCKVCWLPGVHVHSRQILSVQNHLLSHQQFCYSIKG